MGLTVKAVMKILKNITRGLSQVAFPQVCVCCGTGGLNQNRQLCTFCLEQRFQDANPDNERVASDSLLPDGILAQQALWQFDKGGDLQDLLHKLKYERLTTIGIDLGRRLGHRIQKHPYLFELLKYNPAIIVPVSLHQKKYRKRGFNQARKIAEGFQQTWDALPIADFEDIVRRKNTRSQTGFSLEQRLENMDQAFEAATPDIFEGKVSIIVDDVFTTGATTFELAETLIANGADSAVILTVAQA